MTNIHSNYPDRLVVQRIIADIVAEFVGDGAEAVVLMGSVVRGDAQPESDVDLYALGRRGPAQLRRHRGMLFSISWQTAEDVRAAFASPALAPGTVPRWRQAVVYFDAAGTAAALRQEAMAWSWEVVGDTRANDWVAEQVTGLAEEVHKLAANLRRGDLGVAAVQRSILALRLAGIMAVHHRLLYETENHLWALVAGKMGARWKRAQAAALGAGDESFADTCAAALTLYLLASSEIRALLDPRQRAVVRHACALARAAIRRASDSAGPWKKPS